MRIHINITVNRAIQTLLLYLFCIQVSSGLFAPLFAVFVLKFITGSALRTIGFALAFYALMKSLVQIPLAGYLDHHRGEKDDFYALMIGASVSVAVPFLLLIMSRVWHLYALELLSGAGDAALMAAYYSLFARHIDHGSEGFEWSLFSVGGLTVSSAIGAALGGIFADIFGFHFLFITMGIINFLVLFVLLGLWPLLDGARPSALPPFSPIPKSPTAKD